MADPSLPLADWSDASVNALMSGVLSSGWSRWSPGWTDHILFRAVLTGQPRLETDVLAEVDRDVEQRAAGWAKSAPPAGSNPAYDTLVEEDRERGRQHHARLLELALPLGVHTLDTSADCADFLVAAGVLCRVNGQDGTYLVPASRVPLPAERLALTDAERLAEDTLRWKDVHEATCDKIIWLLRPDDDDRPPLLRTSLDAVARRWDLAVEDIRQAVLVLLHDGDFTANADVPRLDRQTEFDLAVDWDAFDISRAVVRPEGA